MGISLARCAAWTFSTRRKCKLKKVLLEDVGDSRVCRFSFAWRGGKPMRSAVMAPDSSYDDALRRYVDMRDDALDYDPSHEEADFDGAKVLKLHSAYLGMK